MPVLFANPRRQVFSCRGQNYAQCKETENVGIKDVNHLNILEEVNVYNSPFLTSETGI